MEKILLDFMKYDNDRRKIKEVQYLEDEKALKYKRDLGLFGIPEFKIKYIEKNIYLTNKNKSKEVYFLDVECQNKLISKVAFIKLNEYSYICLRYSLDDDEYIITGKENRYVFIDDEQTKLIRILKEVITPSFERLEILTKRKIKNLINGKKYEKSIKYIRDFI